jgi:phage tail sheath gpL-like
LANFFSLQFSPQYFYRENLKTITNMSGVGAEIITRIVGYAQNPGNFQQISPNLPIAVGIPAQVNEAQDAGLTEGEWTQITTITQAAAIGGWGSPIYQIAKILFPRSGGGIGGIPVFVYPQKKAGGAAAKVMTVTVTAAGNATGSGTHYVKVAGRTSVEGQSYSVNIVKGDTPTIIAGKISDAINGVLGSPMSGAAALAVATATAKWAGLTSQDITLTMDSGDNDLGVSYAYATTTPGTGTPDVDAAMEAIGNRWITHIINSYGLVTAVMDTLEDFNGRPATETNPATGRWSPTIYKPLLAYTGSVSADPSATTDARLNDCTIKLSPAPLSPGLPMEAAANDCLLAAVCAQNTPHLDTIGASYPDMPVPSDENIGVMANWQNRQTMILKGCSTVDLIGGVYVIQDPVTTFHPVGETVPQHRFARIIVIDWNVRYGYLLKEGQYVLGHTIAKDNEKVAATKVIKPKQWRAILADYADELVLRAICVDAAFMQDSIAVNLSTTNPDRLGSFFKYKRSGVVRVADTEVEAGFNYGVLTAN